MATTAASAVRIASRTGSRLTREKIPPLAISPPTVWTGEDARLSTLDPRASVGRVRLHIASVAGGFGEGDSGFLVRGDNRLGLCRAEGLRLARH